MTSSRHCRGAVFLYSISRFIITDKHNQDVWLIIAFYKFYLLYSNLEIMDVWFSWIMFSRTLHSIIAAHEVWYHFNSNHRQTQMNASTNKLFEKKHRSISLKLTDQNNNRFPVRLKIFRSTFIDTPKEKIFFVKFLFVHRPNRTRFGWASWGLSSFPYSPCSMFCHCHPVLNILSRGLGSNFLPIFCGMLFYNGLSV